MKKKYRFPEPLCRSCPDHRSIGNPICETRYCLGFPKKRNGKRFHAYDPQFKPPKWCPRRLETPACRIYSFANEANAVLDRMLRHDDDPRNHDYAHPSPWKYQFRLELSLGLTAKQFWETAKSDTVESVLNEAQLNYGDVIEIDDGLKPYYFYYVFGALIPVSYFNVELTVKPEVRDET